MDALMERADVEKKKKGENIMKVKYIKAKEPFD